MIKYSYVIQNKDGLHARPAGELIKLSGQYQSSIELLAKGKTVTLKGGIFTIMSLGLSRGDELNITIKGPDEQEACTALKALIEKLL